MYIRELLTQTPRCDTVYNFSPVREAYKNYMKNDLADKLVKRETLTEMDQEICASALLHYTSWTNDNYISAFSIPNWAYYYTFYKGERTLAMIGVLAIFKKPVHGVFGIVNNWTKRAESA